MLRVSDFLADQSVLRSDDAPVSPLVSIILPTFSRRASGLLDRALDSVLAQTFTDWELLVMDDGSVDGSAELIEACRARDPRVVHVRHEWNSGLPALRVNEGIELARGKYLAFQFDDDCWRPDALQTLVAEAVRHAEPAVIVGRCTLWVDGEERMLPKQEVRIHLLYQSNQLANNSALFPRSLVERLGMYDCHVAMRRLCDWDLWLRYCRQVPFVVVDQIISESYAGQANSIGLTVPYDLALFRYLHDIPRDVLLTPSCWRDYHVDATRIGDVTIEKEPRRRLYEDHLVPYYLKQRHHFPGLEGFPATLAPPPKTALYIRNWYEPTHEIAFNHYDPLANRRGNYKAFYQQFNQVCHQWQGDTDLLLLVRSLENQVKTLMSQALADSTPVGYYLDDDLLNFGEYGAEYDYMAPGGLLHKNLVELLTKADVVWCNTSSIAESVQTVTTRTIPHHGCIPADWLACNVRRRDPLKPLRIGYVGTGYRRDEFDYLWDALMCISREFGERLVFEFWGLDIATLPHLASPTVQRRYNPSYLNYISELKKADFDILLMPLLDHPRPRLGKSVSKYFQAAVAGALAIFSDVPQYASLPGGMTCIKPKNSADAWYDAIYQAITMPPAQFDLMRRRMIEHVREEFTDTAQIHLHEAAWRATEFHAKTRRARREDGRPRVMYFLHSASFGGGEIQLWRRLYLAQRYGIEPIVVLLRVLQSTDAARRICSELGQKGIQVEFADYTCLTSPVSPSEFYNEEECTQVRELLQRHAPALVHTVTFIPTIGQVCTELKIPHVASLYAIDDGFTWKDNAQDFVHCQIAQSDSIRYATLWGDLLKAEKMCSRELVPENIFALGQTRYLESLGTPEPAQTKPVHLVVTGTIQARKCQLETIQAVGQLVQEGLDCQLDIYGYTHFYPDYIARCEEQIRALRIRDRVTFHGFSDDVTSILKSADWLLSLSTFESFPSAIKEAMSAGVPVVATPVGGIPELIIDGVSGILCADTSVQAMADGIRRALALSPRDRERIVEQARRVARSEFHPQRVASDLMLMYNRAIDLLREQHPLQLAAALVPEDKAANNHEQVELPEVSAAGSSRLRHQLTYSVAPRQPGWMGLDILVGTHQRPADGTLKLSVLSASGHRVRKVSVDLAAVKDNTFIELRFAPIANSVDTPFVLQFALSNSGPRTKISIYETDPPGNKLFQLLRKIGLARRRDSLYGKLWYGKGNLA